MLWGKKIIFYLLTLYLLLSLFGAVGQIVGNVFVGQKAVKVQMIQTILKDKSNERVFAASHFPELSSGPLVASSGLQAACLTPLINSHVMQHSREFLSFKLQQCTFLISLYKSSLTCTYNRQIAPAGTQRCTAAEPAGVFPGDIIHSALLSPCIETLNHPFFELKQYGNLTWRYT